MVFQMEGAGEDNLPMSQEAYSAHVPGAEAKFEEGTPLKQSTDVTCPPLVLSHFPQFLVRRRPKSACKCLECLAVWRGRCRQRARCVPVAHCTLCMPEDSLLFLF